jgi:hypothetical protein
LCRPAASPSKVRPNYTIRVDRHLLCPEHTTSPSTNGRAAFPPSTVNTQDHFTPLSRLKAHSPLNRRVPLHQHRWIPSAVRASQQTLYSFEMVRNGKNRDLDEKMTSNNLSKWSSKYSHLLFWIFRYRRRE